MSRTSVQILLFFVIVNFLHCGGTAPPSPGGGLTGTISAPLITNPGQVGLRADATPPGNSGFTWTISAGAIVSGQGSSTIFFNAPVSIPASGKITLTCIGPSSSATQDIPVVAPFSAPPAHGAYGPGVGADSLANTPVGGPSNISVSYRFRATKSGTFLGFRKFLIWSATKSGYNGGTGGTLHFQLWTDDGTVAHNPGSFIAGAEGDSVHPSTNGGGSYPLINFRSPPSVTAGTLYHLVVTNGDASPTVNYTSVDDLWTNGALAPAHPTVSDLDWALLIRYQSGNTWSLRQCYLPTLEFSYADGSTQGRGWMEVWVENSKPISGSYGVRERILISEGDQVVTGAYVRLRKVSGASALTIRLEDSTGAMIDSINVPSAKVQSVNYWVGGVFTSPRRLTNGQVYYFTLQAPADTRYDAFPIRDGAFAGYGDFQNASTFGPNCWAEFNDGSGWIGWDQWGGFNRVDGDLQFYLVIQ